MSPHTNPRYLQGLAKLREIDGQAGEHVVASLADIAPDFIDPVSGLDLATLWRAHAQFGEAFEVVDLE